jgi:hypothetical protein
VESAFLSLPPVVGTRLCGVEARALAGVWGERGGVAPAFPRARVALASAPAASCPCVPCSCATCTVCRECVGVCRARARARCVPQIASGVVSSLVAAKGKVSSEALALIGQTMLGLATNLDNIEAITQEGGIALIMTSFHVRFASPPPLSTQPHPPVPTHTQVRSCRPARTLRPAPPLSVFPPWSPPPPSMLSVWLALLCAHSCVVPQVTRHLFHVVPPLVSVRLCCHACEPGSFPSPFPLHPFAHTPAPPYAPTPNAQEGVATEAIAESAVQFLDSLGSLDYDFSDIAFSGLLYADIAAAMKAHPGAWQRLHAANSVRPRCTHAPHTFHHTNTRTYTHPNTTLPQLPQPFPVVSAVGHRTRLCACVAAGCAWEPCV